MSLLADVRLGLLARLNTLQGLNTYGKWPDQVVPPAAIVRFVGGQYEQTMGADTEVLQVDVQIALALKGGIVNAQEAADKYLSNTGADSIRAAIAGDRYLGGAVKYTLMKGWADAEVVEINGQEFYGARVELECWLT